MTNVTEFMLIVFPNLLYYTSVHTQSSYLSSFDDWDQRLSVKNNTGLNSYNQEVRGGIKSEGLVGGSIPIREMNT